MYRTDVSEEGLTMKAVLQRISEYDIFSYYMEEKVRVGTATNSPLREDKNPSFAVYVSDDDRLKYKDFAYDDSGDCFDMVMRMFDVSLPQALAVIDRDFELGMGKLEGDHTMKAKGMIHRDLPKFKGRAKIKVKRRDWCDIDGRYWSQYGISKETLEHFKVSPVDRVWINDRIVVAYSRHSPVYCYHFGNYDYKIYMPMRSKKQGRFLGNTDVIQGWEQNMDHGPLMVVTKSLKDVMVFYEHGIPAIAPQSESVILDDRSAFQLDLFYDRTVVNYDFDHRGIVSSNRMKRLYGMDQFFLTNGRFGSKDYGAKDISDLMRFAGVEQVKELIYEIEGRKKALYGG